MSESGFVVRGVLIGKEGKRPTPRGVTDVGKVSPRSRSTEVGSMSVTCGSPLILSVSRTEVPQRSEFVPSSEIGFLVRLLIFWCPSLVPPLLPSSVSDLVRPQPPLRSVPSRRTPPL